MPVSRGLPLIVVYALYYAILLYGRWVFDVLTESDGCVRSRIRQTYAYLHITRVKIRDGSYIRICVHVLLNAYPYDRGSQISRSLTRDALPFETQRYFLPLEVASTTPRG